MTSLVPSGSLKEFLGKATSQYQKDLKESDQAEDCRDYLKFRSLQGVNAQFFKLGYVANPLPGHEQYRGKLAIPYLTRSGVVQMRFRQIPRRNPLWVPPAPTASPAETPFLIECDPEDLDAPSGDIWDGPDFIDPESDADGFEYEGSLFSSNEDDLAAVESAKAEVDFIGPDGIVEAPTQWLPIDGAKYLSVAGDIPRPYNTADLDRPESFICVCEGEFDTMIAHQDGLPAIGIPGVNGWRSEFRHFLIGYQYVYIFADNDDKGQGKTFAEQIAAVVPNCRIVMLPKGHDVNSYYIAYGAGSIAALLEDNKK